MYYSYVASPLGPLLVVGAGRALSRIGLPAAASPVPPPAGSAPDDDRLAEVRRQLDAYFAGRLRAFALELAPAGTPFQQDVWRALLEIPYGETRSYGEIAARIGRPHAVRAVGQANGANPIPIVVPCHRVIGRTGTLTGYGGGLGAKQWLLDLERGARGLSS